jgi:RNA polymerase-binding transcription factor DksA
MAAMKVISLQSGSNGGYGRYETCGVRIPKSRLEAIPYAALCVRCASQREKGHRLKAK